MALPKISYPIYELTVPSSKKTIKYRPFLVKEEKLLLMAQSGKDTSEIINTLKQVIGNCILTDNFNVDELASFDLEYFFIKLRSKSIGNEITLTYRDLEDNKKYEVVVNLDDVEMKESDSHINKIEISDKLGLYLKYPTTDSSILNLDDDEQADAIFNIIAECIDTIYDESGTYNTKDYTKEEVNEFVSSLDIKAFEKIQAFFESMPKLYYEVKYTNSLGKEKVIPLTNLNDFFTLG